jgi:hypothetical protein
VEVRVLFGAWEKPRDRGAFFVLGAHMVRDGRENIGIVAAAASGTLTAMRYDLYLLPEQAGEDPVDVVERLEEEDRPASEDDRARVRALVAALRAALPTPEDHTGDVAGA